MKKVSDYRFNARQCRALAEKMQSPEERQQLLQMAEHWEALASDRCALLRRHPEQAEDPNAATKSPRTS
jgi:hypothetical protein